MSVLPTLHPEPQALSPAAYDRFKDDSWSFRGPRNAGGSFSVIAPMSLILRRVLAVLAFATGASTVPHRLCAMEAADWFGGELETQEAMARAVDHWVAGGVVARTFATGSARFDSEWIFGTYQMAALGFGQVALEHAEARATMRPRMERAIDRMLARDTRAFDTEAWGSDAVDGLGGEEGHAAFLGYSNLVLSLHRTIYRDSKYSSLNDRMTGALERRFEHSPTSLIATYPREVFPVDNAAGIASIALHARATGQAVPAIVPRWSIEVRERYVHRPSGLLIQIVEPDGTPLDAPRGSGTALAAYFLSFSDPALSKDLHDAVDRELAHDVVGFRLVSEYPESVPKGRGDIDSGPLVFGLSVSATGFSLGGCRIHGDAACYESTLASVNLFGAPTKRSDVGRTYVSGGPLGDAILFAMQTARRVSP